MPEALELPSQDYLNSILRYEDGKLIWINEARKRNTWNQDHSHKLVGMLTGKGYIRIYIDGIARQIHRIIWVMHNGPIADGYHIDHIDRDKINNRIENLRVVLPYQSSGNTLTTRKNQSGYRGVYKHGRFYRAIVRYKRKVICKPGFTTAKAAHEYYLKKRKELYGEYDCI